MIENEAQLVNSRAKLKTLEERHALAATRPMASEGLREMTLWSLKNRINRMVEEITRYECRKREAVQAR